MERLKDNGQVRGCYVSPETDVFGIRPEELLCQSGSVIDDLNLREDDSAYWN